MAEETKDPMDPRVSRMVSEYTELVTRIDAAHKFADAHDLKNLDEDEDINAEEYEWLVEQIMAMSCYAHALEQRILINGYNVRVVDGPEDIK